MGIIEVEVNYCPTCGLFNDGNKLNLKSLTVKKGFLHGEFVVTEFSCSNVDCKTTGYLTVSQ